jgi:hypothetical protein
MDPGAAWRTDCLREGKWNVQGHCAHLWLHKSETHYVAATGVTALQWTPPPQTTSPDGSGPPSVGEVRVPTLPPTVEMTKKARKPRKHRYKHRSSGLPSLEPAAMVDPLETVPVSGDWSVDCHLWSAGADGGRADFHFISKRDFHWESPWFPSWNQVTPLHLGTRPGIPPCLGWLSPPPPRWPPPEVSPCASPCWVSLLVLRDWRRPGSRKVSWSFNQWSPLHVIFNNKWVGHLGILETSQE